METLLLFVSDMINPVGFVRVLAKKLVAHLYVSQPQSQAVMAYREPH